MIKIVLSTAKYFLIIRNYVLSVSLQRQYNFYHPNTLFDDFRTNSRNISGRNPTMGIPLLANQDLTPMLVWPETTSSPESIVLTQNSCYAKEATCFIMDLKIDE